MMPFMDEPPGGLLSTNLIRPYGALIRNLRKRLRRPAPADRRAARSRTRNKLPARPDPRRRRHGAERNRRGVRGRDRDRRGGDAAARGGQTPLREEVKGFCEILGLDLLYLANEGKLVAIVPEKAAEAALAALRRDPLGREAAVIGRVVQGEPGRVTMRTAFGGSRCSSSRATRPAPTTPTASAPPARR
jgi:hydrogenase expression/formation protein HypE